MRLMLRFNSTVLPYNTDYSKGYTFPRLNKDEDALASVFGTGRGQIVLVGWAYMTPWLYWGELGGGRLFLGNEDGEVFHGTDDGEGPAVRVFVRSHLALALYGLALHVLSILGVAGAGRLMLAGSLDRQDVPMN